MPKDKLLRLLSVLLVMCVLNACGSTPEQESTGQFFDSSLITAKIKALLIDDPVTSAAHIKVTTFKSRVELSGSVKNQDEKLRAEQIARQVTGVKEVINKLVIEK